MVLVTQYLINFGFLGLVAMLLFLRWWLDAEFFLKVIECKVYRFKGEVLCNELEVAFFAFTANGFDAIA